MSGDAVDQRQVVKWRLIRCGAVSMSAEIRPICSDHSSQSRSIVGPTDPAPFQIDAAGRRVGDQVDRFGQRSHRSGGDR